MTPNEQRWMLIEGNRETGPFTREQLQRRYANNEIHGDCLCCPKKFIGLLNWNPLKHHFPEFSRVSAPDLRGVTSHLPIISDTTHCHVYYSGQQHGPFVPRQIQSMWSAGTLTADTFVCPDGYPDWIPIGDFLNRLPHGNSSLTSPNAESRIFGRALTVVGVAITIYFAALYDTTVRTEFQYSPQGGYIGGDAVVNLARQQNRLIGVIAGIAMSIVGVVIVCVPSKNESS